MLRDVDELPDGAELEAEVAVVGAGFAGLDLACFLGRQGVRVVLLESGREQFDPATQALTRVESVGKALRTPDPEGPFTPYLPAVFRGESRIRQLGGTSNIWTGKWRAFDPIDFAARPWIPDSGWPIRYEELVPFYRELMREYGIADFDGFARSEPFARARAQLAGAGLKLSFHYWQATAIRARAHFRDEVAGSDGIEAILGANATELLLDEGHERVELVRFASLDGRRFAVRADTVVLAMGGLEGARLLLASNHQLPAGVGNGRGLVGRFYMDHPKTKGGRVWPGPALAAIAPWTATEPRPRFHVSLSLGDELQAGRRLPNHAIYLKPVYTYQVNYPEQQLEQLRRALAARRLGAIAAAAWALLRSPQALWKIARRRRHGDDGGPVAYYETSLYMEQVPNRESALSLGEERDAVGMPRLKVDWRLTPYDREAFREVIRELTEAFERAGLGRLEFGDTPPDLDADLVDAAHHIGATRMATTPERGVVDRDCRVFGTANLYIASSSVFPTGHSAGPTLTILALARRLGVHLMERRAAGRQLEDEGLSAYAARHEVVSLGLLAAAVGAEAPGRDEERHVVMPVGIGDAKGDRHHVEEGRVGERHAAAGEVGPDEEAQLIPPRAEL
jgi:choline dehydrogenase-like flavoprotein